MDLNYFGIRKERIGRTPQKPLKLESNGTKFETTKTKQIQK